MNKRVIGIALVIIAIIVIAYIVTAQTHAKHSVTLILKDGSETDPLNLLAVLSGGKVVSFIKYRVEGEGIDITDYSPTISSDFHTVNLESKNSLPAEWIINITDVLDYLADDGIHTITVKPVGHIYYDGTEEYLDEIKFDLEFEDRRALIIEFG